MAKTKNTASPDENECIVTYPESLCRTQHAKNDNSVFRSISFRFKDAWATFALPEDHVTPTVRRNGETVPNRLTLHLGDSEDVRFVSIKKDDNSYEKKPFFNRTIKSLIDSEKHEYLRSIAI